MTKEIIKENTKQERKCFICGKKTKLTKTECCDQWICNDEDKYVLFSFAHNSCYRNHRKYTLCAQHYNEGHKGDWQTCEKCKQGIEPEMYVYFGTNEYNNEVLKNPPKFKPTHCIKCKSIIILSEGGYTWTKEGYICMFCYEDMKEKDK